MYVLRLALFHLTIWDVSILLFMTKFYSFSLLYYIEKNTTRNLSFLLSVEILVACGPFAI